MGIRGLLWRALGGVTDPDGAPIAGPDDRVPVFEGVPTDAKVATDVLADEGFDTKAELLNPQRTYPYAPVESALVVVTVAGREHGEARRVLARHPQLGNRLQGPDPLLRPSGFAALAEFATPVEADTAVALLQQAKIASILTPPRVAGIDDGVGFVVSVPASDLAPAVDLLRRAAGDVDPRLHPIDLVQPEDARLEKPVERPAGVRLRWFGWMFASLMLGLLALGLLLVFIGAAANGDWAGTPFALVAAAIGWISWRGLKRAGRYD